MHLYDHLTPPYVAAIDPTDTPSPSPSPALPDPWSGMAEVLPPTWVIVLAAVAAVVLGIAVAAAYRALIPAPGWATALDIRREMSAAAARKMVPRTRPSLAGRKGLPVSEYSYPIGRSSSPLMWVRGTPEDSALVIGPPGAGKSVWMTNVVVDAPGAVVHTSSKVADHLKTREFREQVGSPVLVFNPQGLGGVPSTLRWNPIRGCEDPDMAIEQAGFLLYGARKAHASSSMDDYFNSNANEVLRAFLHAAALGGKTLVDVHQWANDPDDTTALKILIDAGADPSWIHTLRARQEVTDRTRDGIFSTLATALSWLSGPGAAATVTPGPGEETDLAEFIKAGGTLYLIGEHRESSSVAPVFTLLITRLVQIAKQIASESPGGRLDPWLTLALDEVATICPVPLDSWINTVRELGILPICAIQSKAQLEERWGRAGADEIWGAVAYTLVLRGIKSAADLQELSELCGEREVTRTSVQYGPRGTTRTQHREIRPLMPPHRIRSLKKGRMLVIYRGAPPVMVKIIKPWKRRDLRKRETAAVTVEQ